MFALKTNGPPRYGQVRRAIIHPMFPDDENRESFIHSIAREVRRSADRLAELDTEEIARTIGVDPETTREWAGFAQRWARAQADRLDDDLAFGRPGPKASPSRDDPLSTAGPHPLDLPTEEQGRALAALESGRWTVEPGTDTLAARGEGPPPDHALGLVRELRARDWITADGDVTLVGRRALSRWLDASTQR
jgi:hypothetical protein